MNILARWLPGLAVLRRYDPAWLRQDLTAGLVLTTMLVPVGIAYAIWSGVGILLVSIAGFVLYRQSLDFPAITGISLIVTGVIVLCLFSKAAVH